jgi:hypothetical protein
LAHLRYLEEEGLVGTEMENGGFVYLLKRN